MIESKSSGYISENILSEKELLTRLERLRKESKKIGLCTGSFDLLHPGHITHLEEAKKNCDILVVAIALDSFSSKKKPNSGRPIFSEQLRAFMISRLKSVDYVILHDGSANIIEIIKPDFYFKGPDYIYKNDSVLNQQIEIMKSYGGKIYYTSAEKLSTTEIIKYIKNKIK
ncbi:FAD synthase [uncultured archaeon]|nr:FAD synthase [uncultured archaeon]